jgi:regulator of RNase E activity RraA
MDDLLTRLSRVDACAVSDALDTLGLSGTVTGLDPLTANRRISGRVITVKLEADDGRPVASRHMSTAAVEASGPGDVIVVEQRTRVDAAGWGGNLALGARLRGVEGVIVDGPVRDVDEARQHGFPVFARGHTPRTARGRLVETGTNVPVTIGDVTVSPGDFVVADGSGVVFVPAAHVERVLATAEAITSRERAMAASLQEGTPISQVMDRRYETMLRGDED